MGASGGAARRCPWWGRGRRRCAGPSPPRPFPKPGLCPGTRSSNAGGAWSAGCGWGQDGGRVGEWVEWRGGGGVAVVWAGRAGCGVGEAAVGGVSVGRRGSGSVPRSSNAGEAESAVRGRGVGGQWFPGASPGPVARVAAGLGGSPRLGVYRVGVACRCSSPSSTAAQRQRRSVPCSRRKAMALTCSPAAMLAQASTTPGAGWAPWHMRMTGRAPRALRGVRGASSASWSYASPMVCPSIQCTGRWPLRTARRRSANQWWGRTRRGVLARCGGTDSGLRWSCRPVGRVLFVLIAHRPRASEARPNTGR